MLSYNSQSVEKMKYRKLFRFLEGYLKFNLWIFSFHCSSFRLVVCAGVVHLISIALVGWGSGRDKIERLETIPALEEKTAAAIMLYWIPRLLRRGLKDRRDPLQKLHRVLLIFVSVCRGNRSRLSRELATIFLLFEKRQVPRCLLAYLAS